MLFCTYPQGYSSSDAFIAAQAPLEATRDDVWEVIWQWGASMVVLLCQPEEDEKVRMYIPYIGMHGREGGYTSYIQIHTLPNYCH